MRKLVANDNVSIIITLIGLIAPSLILTGCKGGDISDLVGIILAICSGVAFLVGWILKNM